MSAECAPGALDEMIALLDRLALPWTLYAAYQADGSRGYCAVVDCQPSGAEGLPTPLEALAAAVNRRAAAAGWATR